MARLLAQAERVQAAVEDVVQHIQRNAGHILTDAADVEFLYTGTPVSRDQYRRLVRPQRARLVRKPVVQKEAKA
jgi:DNA-binding transcriptional regulator YbjK